MTNVFDLQCECGHPLWLHRIGCSGQLPAGSSQMQFKACPCTRVVAR